jgi:hypothetical protein
MCLILKKLYNKNNKIKKYGGIKNGKNKRKRKRIDGKG